MKKRSWFIGSFLIFCLIANGQSPSGKSFVPEKMKIDSMISDINNKQGLSARHITGNCIFGEFDGLAYYYSDKSLMKIVYDFKTDSSGSKVFYYKDTSLIKVEDKGIPLYNTTKGLVYSNESPCDCLRTGTLLTFSRQFRDLLNKMFQ